MEQNMESLTETTWDVVIHGTGLQQSLLALYVSFSQGHANSLLSNPWLHGRSSD